MTTDRTGPVLDLERLDAAADEALAGVRLDLGAVCARAAVERRGLVLRFYEDLTETATAEVLGVSVSTVKSQARHALGRLQVLAPDLVLLRDPVRDSV